MDKSLQGPKISGRKKRVQSKIGDGVKYLVIDTPTKGKSRGELVSGRFPKG